MTRERARARARSRAIRPRSAAFPLPGEIGPFNRGQFAKKGENERQLRRAFPSSLKGAAAADREHGARNEFKSDVRYTFAEGQERRILRRARRWINAHHTSFPSRNSFTPPSFLQGGGKKTASLVNSGHDRWKGEGRRRRAERGLNRRGRRARVRSPARLGRGCARPALPLGRLTTGESQGSPQMPHLPPLVLHWNGFIKRRSSARSRACPALELSDEPEI